MKGIFRKNLSSLAALLSLFLGIMLTNAISSDQSLDSNGIYTVKIDNKVTVKMGREGFLYEPVYLFGVALDEHTLVLPLAYIDDAEGQKFLFYFMDTGVGLMALITQEVLQPVELSTVQGMDNDSGYDIVSCKNGVTSYKSGKDLRNMEEGSVNFVFNKNSELNGISYNTHIDSKVIKRFYNEYLEVVNKDGGIDEVFRKLLPPK
jgi:hypothetical protein